MERRGPWAVGAADNPSRFKLVKLCFSLLESEGIKAVSFGKNRRASGVDVMLDTMMRRKIVEIRRKDGRKRVKKVLERREQIRKRVESRGSGQGW